jgi:hypothetical protein
VFGDSTSHKGVFASHQNTDANVPWIEPLSARNGILKNVSALSLGSGWAGRIRLVDNDTKLPARTFWGCALGDISKSE